MENIIVGIHGGTKRSFTDYAVRYEKVLAFNNIKYLRLHASNQAFWERIKEVDYFIYRWRHSHSDSQKTAGAKDVCCCR